MTLAERRHERDRIFGEAIAMLSSQYNFDFRSRTDPTIAIRNPKNGPDSFWDRYERRGTAVIDPATTVELTRDHRADCIKVTCIHRIGNTDEHEIVSMDCENTSALFISEVVKMFIRQVQ